MRTLPYAAMLALLLSGTAAARPAQNIQDSMNAADFKATGLDKLTPQELARLNEWLQGHHASAAGSGRPDEDRRGFKEETADRERITSRIVGEFRGWSGNGEFVLENGQVWRQSGAGQLVGVRMTNPAVTIIPGVFGSWRLKVEGYNSSVDVERIK